jgi:pimeloyl-ACP methyl ester carboxylesterase
VVVGWNRSPEAFSAIKCPTQLIAGDRDEFNDVEDTLTLYRIMPNAEVLVIPRADHLGLVRHPMVFQALFGFYGRVPR